MNRPALAFVAVLALLVVTVGAVAAYSDDTVAIHRTATCAADGFCTPELYVERQNTGLGASVRVDYAPSWERFVWNITVRNVRYLSVDAQSNYLTRGCTTFFVDCPHTDYYVWLLKRSVLTVNLDTDVVLRFRADRVPMPSRATLDGNPYTDWTYTGSAVTANRIVPEGVRVLVIYFGGDDSGPADPFDPVSGAVCGVGIGAALLAVLVLARRRRKTS